MKNMRLTCALLLHFPDCEGLMLVREHATSLKFRVIPRLRHALMVTPFSLLYDQSSQ